MSDYNYKLADYDGHERGELTCCDACGYPAPLATFPSGIGKEPLDLCQLCANTDAGNAASYPEQHEARSVLYAICAVGNALLDAMGPKRSYRGPMFLASRPELQVDDDEFE